MNGPISRGEYIILLLVLVVAVIPLVQDGGLLRLLYEGINNSSVDSGVISTIRLGMVLIMIVAVVRLLNRRGQ